MKIFISIFLLFSSGGFAFAQSNLNNLPSNGDIQSQRYKDAQVQAEQTRQQNAIQNQGWLNDVNSKMNQDAADFSKSQLDRQNAKSRVMVVGKKEVVVDPAKGWVYKDSGKKVPPAELQNLKQQ